MFYLSGAYTRAEKRGRLAAAVQREARPADVGGPGGREEQARRGHGGDLARVAVLLGYRLGRHEPRHDAVDPDRGTPLDGEAGDQVVQAGLGGAVGGRAR